MGSLLALFLIFFGIWYVFGVVLALVTAPIYDEYVAYRSALGKSTSRLSYALRHHGAYDLGFYTKLMATKNGRHKVYRYQVKVFLSVAITITLVAGLIA